MAFLDAFNSWSVLHLLGSFIFTLTVGSLNLPLSPMGSGSVVLSLGTGWELVADQALRLNDKRGGDYYDVAWDFAGCALGTALLEVSRNYHEHHAPRDFGFKWARSPGAMPAPIDDQLGLNAIALKRKVPLAPIQLQPPNRMVAVQPR